MCDNVYPLEISCRFSASPTLVQTAVYCICSCFCVCPPGCAASVRSPALSRSSPRQLVKRLREKDGLEQMTLVSGSRFNQVFSWVTSVSFVLANRPKRDVIVYIIIMLLFL